MATTTSDRPSPTPGPSGSGAPEQDRPGRHWPSLRELFTIHREGPVTTSERRRSAVYSVVAMVLLAGAVGVIHLIDGSRQLDRSTLDAFVVVGVVVAVLGYAFPRFTTTPALAMMSRHPDRNSTSSKVALILFGLMLFVIAAVKLYY